MYMRVALAIHGEDLPRVLETYHALSQQLYTHASPVLYNDGTVKHRYASCYLYQPTTPSPADMLGSALDLDELWLSDGGVGLSLDAVPAQR